MRGVEHVEVNMWRVQRTVLAAVALAALSLPVHAATLSLADRIEAQRAIERVFHRHRIWPDANPQPKPTFEASVPDALLREKVEDALRKSAVLEAVWGRALAGDDLQAELDRMAANTRQPDVLRELFDALGHDPTLLAECLSRPLLVDRVIRDAYASDPRIHDGARKAARAGAARITDLPSMRAAGGGTRSERSSGARTRGSAASRPARWCWASRSGTTR
jgi:hypothetical protein